MKRSEGVSPGLVVALVICAIVVSGLSGLLVGRMTKTRYFPVTVTTTATETVHPTPPTSAEKTEKLLLTFSGSATDLPSEVKSPDFEMSSRTVKITMELTLKENASALASWSLWRVGGKRTVAFSGPVSEPGIYRQHCYGLLPEAFYYVRMTSKGFEWKITVEER